MKATTTKIHPYIYVGLNETKVSNDITIERVTKTVCEYFEGIKPQDLLTRSRKSERCIARYIVWHLVKKHNPAITIKRLGQYFDRDHTTVLNGFWQINNLMETCEKMRFDVSAIENLLNLPRVARTENARIIIQLTNKVKPKFKMLTELNNRRK